MREGLRTKEEIVENMKLFGWNIDSDAPNFTWLHVSVDLVGFERPMMLSLEGSVEDWMNQIFGMIDACADYSISGQYAKHDKSLPLAECVERSVLESAVLHAALLILTENLPAEAKNAILSVYLAGISGLHADAICLPDEQGMYHFAIWYMHPWEDEFDENDDCEDCDGDCTYCQESFEDNDDSCWDEDEDDECPPPDKVIPFHNGKELSDAVEKFFNTFSVSKYLETYRMDICEQYVGEDGNVWNLPAVYSAAVLQQGSLLQFSKLLKKYMA